MSYIKYLCLALMIFNTGSVFAHDDSLDANSKPHIHRHHFELLSEAGALDPKETLELALSAFHFSATQEACDQLLSRFGRQAEGISQLLVTRLEDIPLVSIQAHRCLLNYADDKRVQAALIEDVAQTDRPAFVELTVSSISQGKNRDPKFLREFIPALMQSALSSTTRENLINKLRDGLEPDPASHDKICRLSGLATLCSNR